MTTGNIREELKRGSILHKALELKDGPQEPSAAPLEKPQSPSRLPLRFWLTAVFSLAALVPAWVFAGEAPLDTHISGYIKTLNFFTKTTGLTPELADNPLAAGEKRESLFSNMERIRLKLKSAWNINEKCQVTVKIDYDHGASFGSFVSSGDFRMAHNLSEKRQFLDLSQDLVEENGALYEHRLYRASVVYENDDFSAEVGRQQIPWGVGHFFTPTDLFNPFSPTQIELEERDGVDAVNLIAKNFAEMKWQFIYTPRGRDLHPQRFLGRVSKDIYGFEMGVLGGRIQRDHALGFDFQGNVKSSAVRGEFLYREVDHGRDFIKFTLNADYNLPHNVYGLLEYHFNGEGRRNTDDYEVTRFIEGDIQQLAKNYTALLLGYNITPLLRFEHRMILNMDDTSVFLRPELRYELRSNLLLTLAAQLYGGGPNEEYGLPENLYIGEMNYSF